MNVITQSEHEKLKQLESIINRGKKAFVEVGLALREIRDSRLYRVSHKTFEAYVGDRWGFERRHAIRLIDAAQVVENVSNWTQTQPILPSTESQARELAKLPAEEQAEAWEEVTQTTDAPTAKAVKEVVEKRQEAKANNAGKEQASPTIDAAAERARRIIPDLCKSLRLQLGNLGAGRRFDKSISEIEEFAR